MTYQLFLTANQLYRQFIQKSSKKNKKYKKNYNINNLKIYGMGTYFKMNEKAFKGRSLLGDIPYEISYL